MYSQRTAAERFLFHFTVLLSNKYCSAAAVSSPSGRTKGCGLGAGAVNIAAGNGRAQTEPAARQGWRGERQDGEDSPEKHS